MTLTARPNRMTIFRKEDAETMEESDINNYDPITPGQMEALGKLVEAGLGKGEEVRILCNFPGFSLAYLWFKKDYPLPLHKHDTDCLYYIVSGTIQLGTEVLGPRDSFYLPKDVPYTYRPGEDGVELLEFRHETKVATWLMAKPDAAYWSKATTLIEERREEWEIAPRPSEVVSEAVA